MANNSKKPLEDKREAMRALWWNYFIFGMIGVGCIPFMLRCQF